MGKIIAPDRFEMIATAGAGRTANITAHTIAVFRDSLYLGSSCGSFGAPDSGPCILRYAESTGEWETIYEPPLIEPTVRSHVPDLQIVSHWQRLSRFGQDRNQPGDGAVPRDTGYCSMQVFRGKSDREPSLYVSSMSRHGGALLRSRDGETFEQVGEPGLGNRDVYSFRGLAAFGGRLFAAPAGIVTDEYLDRYLAPEAKVYVAEDPVSGAWREASEIGFGDPNNESIYTLATAHGQLYAGTANPARGFQLWRTAAKGRPPYKWERVITDGAGAFNHNLAVTAMAEFNGALYVGSGITGFGSDVVHDVGPASAELLRVHPDGTWELIAGRMRFTEDGLKVPLSLLGPGLGDFYNSAVWSLGVHDGALYLGTHQWEAFRAFEAGGEIVGGYQLWASENGEDWELVLDDGHGNPAELGISTITSTPMGLVIGTDNSSPLLKLLGRGRDRRDLQFPDGFRVLLGR